MTIQLRGQWKDARSVTRYLKKGVLLRQQARLGKARMRAAADAERVLRRRLASEIVRRVPVASTNVFSASSKGASFEHVIKDKRRHEGPSTWRAMKRAHR